MALTQQAEHDYSKILKKYQIDLEVFQLELKVFFVGSSNDVVVHKVEVDDCKIANELTGDFNKKLKLGNRLLSNQLSIFTFCEELIERKLQENADKL